MLKTIEERLKEVDDVDLVVGVDEDLTTSRVLAKTHFGRGSEKNTKLVLAIFQEMSRRRARAGDDD